MAAMNRPPVSTTQNSTRRLSIAGYTFVQATYTRTNIPAHTEHGHPIYAVPGGGFATKEQLEKVLESK